MWASWGLALVLKPKECMNVYVLSLAELGGLFCQGLGFFDCDVLRCHFANCAALHPACWLGIGVV
jgi:hypothetical protein